MSICPEHSNLIITVTEIKQDVKWIKSDREEQKKRYEQRKSNKRWIIGILLTIVGLGVATISLYAQLK